MKILNDRTITEMWREWPKQVCHATQPQVLTPPGGPYLAERSSACPLVWPHVALPIKASDLGVDSPPSNRPTRGQMVSTAGVGQLESWIDRVGAHCLSTVDKKNTLSIDYF